MDRLKFIKLIVFVLTFLLIFGTLTAGGIIIKKISKKNHIPAEISLQQPGGSYIKSFKIVDDQIAVLVSNPKASDKIIIIKQGNEQPQQIIKLSNEE